MSVYSEHLTINKNYRHHQFASIANTTQLSIDKTYPLSGRK